MRRTFARSRDCSLRRKVPVVESALNPNLRRTPKAQDGTEGRGAGRHQTAKRGEGLRLEPAPAIPDGDRDSHTLEKRLNLGRRPNTTE